MHHNETYKGCCACALPSSSYWGRLFISLGLRTRLKKNWHWSLERNCVWDCWLIHSFSHKNTCLCSRQQLNSSPDVSRQNAQKSVSPYDRYPDTAVALSQLAIKPRLCGQTRESLNWNKWKWSRNTENKKSLGRPPKGLASYVTQHKCDSFFIWTHKLRMPSLPTNSLQRQQSANHRLRRRKKTLGCCQKYHLATRNTGHSWPTYSHLIMLAHYTQCNMALHPLAHAAVSNNAGLFQQYEYIYSWRPLMETPAFQSSLTASGKKVRASEIKGEREERTPPPRLSWKDCS